MAMLLCNATNQNHHIFALHLFLVSSKSKSKSKPYMTTKFVPNYSSSAQFITITLLNYNQISLYHFSWGIFNAYLNLQNKYIFLYKDAKEKSRRGCNLHNNKKRGKEFNREVLTLYMQRTNHMHSYFSSIVCALHEAIMHLLKSLLKEENRQQHQQYIQVTKKELCVRLLHIYNSNDLLPPPPQMEQ